MIKSITFVHVWQLIQHIFIMLYIQLFQTKPPKSDPNVHISAISPNSQSSIHLLHCPPSPSPPALDISTQDRPQPTKKDYLRMGKQMMKLKGTFKTS